jgi:hypothetical protein
MQHTANRVIEAKCTVLQNSLAIFINPILVEYISVHMSLQSFPHIYSICELWHSYMNLFCICFAL